MKYGALYQRVCVLAPVSKAEWKKAEALGSELQLKKRGHFLRAGDDADRFAFVLEGLLRTYRVSEDGEESVKAFRAEGELVAAYAEQIQKRPSLTFIQALEPSRLLAFTTGDFDLLEAGHACWTQLARRVAEQQFVLKERREQEFLDLDAGQRLDRFWLEHPHLAGRLSQVEVAAYLGITPVALSRIKSKKKKA